MEVNSGCLYLAAEALFMPFRTERLNNSIDYWLPAFFALGREAVSMTIDTPRVPVLFDKRSVGIEWLSKLISLSC
jgi:hypothetical protein